MANTKYWEKELEKLEIPEQTGPVRRLCESADQRNWELDFDGRRLVVYTTVDDREWVLESCQERNDWYIIDLEIPETDGYAVVTDYWLKNEEV